MNADPSEAFLSTARSRELLSAEAAAALSREALERGVAVTQLAIEKGVMDEVAVDEVETLLRPDRAIPGYQVLDVLGRGGMGVVYRARQTNLDRVVAIKTVLVSQLGKSGVAARFEKEARTVARLRHPNIVTAYDFGRHEGRLYFVMELLEGHDLDRFLMARGCLKEAVAWGIARQAAAGLAHASEAGIVHRDVKPANLFLIEPPQGYPLPANVPLVKVTDFGLVLRPDGDGGRMTMAGTTLGTPAYMAPEQVASSEVDSRADIYALGATVYHALVGRPPFEGKSAWEVMAKKAEGRLPPLEIVEKNASPASAELLADMLAADPAARIGGYPLLLARIDRLLGSSPERMLSATRTLAMPTRRLRRRRIAWIGALAGLLTAGLAAAIYTIATHHAPPPSAQQLPVTVVAPQPLFDGKTLALGDWLFVEGVWNPTSDAEGGRVLAGKGVIRRRLPPLDNYRITMGADLHGAKAVELHFAVQEADAAQPRYVLRMTADGGTLERRQADHGDAKPVAPPLPFPPRAETAEAVVYHELRIDRVGTTWWAYLDGRLVASAPADPQRELPEFRLAVEGDTALFESLELTGLREK
jgi:hypothetical protein